MYKWWSVVTNNELVPSHLLEWCLLGTFFLGFVLWCSFVSMFTIVTDRAYISVVLVTLTTLFHVATMAYTMHWKCEHVQTAPTVRLEVMSSTLWTLTKRFTWIFWTLTLTSTLNVWFSLLFSLQWWLWYPPTVCIVLMFVSTTGVFGLLFFSWMHTLLPANVETPKLSKHAPTDAAPLEVITESVPVHLEQTQQLQPQQQQQQESFGSTEISNSRTTKPRRVPVREANQ